MMFVHDAPAPVAFAKTHEPKLKLSRLAIALHAAAAPDRRGKGYIRSSGDLQIGWGYAMMWGIAPVLSAALVQLV
jgi:hypothetical protein